MDNYFNNSNTKVTVKKYGSTFDRKIVPDKNLIPITERPNRKAEQEQALTESMARFSENLNKVNARELNDLKEQRLAEKIMVEGYATLKDNLLKDVMRQVCVESLLVDDDVVLENINIIHDLVDTQVDSMGGYKGLKESTTRTKNPVLESIVEAIDSTAKVVGDRVLQEAKCAKEMSFEMNADEVRDFDYKKRDLGVDEITDFVKDRVYKVVQDEQNASKQKGEVLDEIETKLKDAQTDVAVEEAMSEMFDTKGLEDLTLFESLMRSGYKNLLESSSSAIFESTSFDDCDEDDDEEYSMSDIELDDDNEEIDEDDIDDDVEEELVSEGFDLDIAKAFNSNAPAVMEALNSEDFESLEEALDKMADDVETVAEACKSRSKATKVKESIRKVQTSTSEVVDEACKAKRKACKEELVVCPSCGEDPCVCDDLQEGKKMSMSDVESLINYDYKEMQDNDKKVKKYILKLVKGSKSNADLEIVDSIVRKHVNYLKPSNKDAEFTSWVNSTFKDDVARRKSKLSESVDLEEGCKKSVKEACKKTIKEENEVKEKDNKNSEELTEGVMKNAKVKVQEKIADFFQNKLAKMLAKRDYEPVRKNLTELVASCEKINDLNYLAGDLKLAVKQLENAKLRYPDGVDKIDEHLNWIQNDYKKMIEAKRKEIKAQTVKESFDARLDAICESLNTEIDKHEDALNLALESINVIYDGNEICAPMLRAKDCNLSNIEMAYKTKVVCESLKNLFSQVESLEEVKQLEEMVNLNLQYISEAKNSLSGNANEAYKTRLLCLAEGYLGKITKNTGVLTEGLLLEGANAEVDCTDAINQVRDVYETVNNNELMEGTNDDFMEVVLAEAIVKYTIMESFSTLNLQTYNSDQIQKMAKANIR